MDAVKDDMNRHRTVRQRGSAQNYLRLHSFLSHLFYMVGFRLRGLLQRAVSTLGSTLHVKSGQSLFRYHVTLTPLQFFIKNDDFHGVQLNSESNGL